MISQILVGVHCIAHREALVISDVSKDIPELILVEKIANKVHMHGLTIVTKGHMKF